MEDYRLTVVEMMGAGGEWGIWVFGWQVSTDRK